MSKLKVPINELHRSIAKNEKALNIQKRGLALLEQAEATLAGGHTTASVAKKHGVSSGRTGCPFAGRGGRVGAKEPSPSEVERRASREDPPGPGQGARCQGEGSKVHPKEEGRQVGGLHF